MEIKRYKKTRNSRGHYEAETCDSSEFVAFWTDSKYVSARDRAGAEWLLVTGYALRDIEAGTAADGIIRIHHSRLVRRDCIDSYHYVQPKGSAAGYGVAVVGGYEYRVSRTHWRQRMSWIEQRQQQAA